MIDVRFTSVFDRLERSGLAFEVFFWDSLPSRTAFFNVFDKQNTFFNVHSYRETPTSFQQYGRNVLWMDYLQQKRRIFQIIIIYVFICFEINPKVSTIIQNNKLIRFF